MSVLDAIAKQYEKSKSGGSSGGSYEQDFSKYFAVRLEEGVDSGVMHILKVKDKDAMIAYIKSVV